MATVTAVLTWLTVFQYGFGGANKLWQTLLNYKLLCEENVVTSQEIN
jgi:hypothetical protein